MENVENSCVKNQPAGECCGEANSEIYTPQNHLRVITATSLFDGHDASINIMRRMLLSGGVEVIHLGHNKSVEEIVHAAVQEDVQGIAISSYQGGHMEFFKYLVDLLKEKNSSHIKVFGGGGGVIIPSEIRELMQYGVEKIYSPADGAKYGLTGIITDMIKRMDFSLLEGDLPDIKDISPENSSLVARSITLLEENPGNIKGFRELI